MIDSEYAALAVCGMAGVTVLLRAVPFIGANLLKRFPLVERLGRFLPPAIMSLLLVHTLHGSASANPAGPWPELIAASAVIVLQLWLRQALASILFGTALYVVLRNVPVFG
ncbi:branched-chain amino acid transporter permease [Caldimonas brevitalea]|uniref:Branched-chain amino acid ABC transporter n=1 Tax=Caldimonas brevitalea TaxID=413882 RepID=A0A0G3BVY3_9BURK|nr:AzlD domain-containing protein [Caldimonas brevitalea]AKJ31531.1 branched-chain amino acid ABC transporter [Caldimonas brevitalea]